MYILVAGNVLDGFEFYGPYNTLDGAERGKRHLVVQSNVAIVSLMTTPGMAEEAKFTKQNIPLMPFKTLKAPQESIDFLKSLLPDNSH